MCEIGMRVTVGEGAVDGVGTPVQPGHYGMVIGHLGRKWAIISLDEGGRTVLVPEGSAIPRKGTKSTAVVVQPSGRASALSRKDSERVRVRSPR